MTAKLKTKLSYTHSTVLFYCVNYVNMTEVLNSFECTEHAYEFLLINDENVKNVT